VVWQNNNSLPIVVESVVATSNTDLSIGVEHNSVQKKTVQHSETNLSLLAFTGLLEQL
jgi:hypothetical protein